MLRLAAMLMAIASLFTVSPAHAAGLQQGGFEHRVKLDLPPAPRGTGPSVSLVADHLANDGVLGHGWRLTGFSQIQRVSDTQGVPAMLSTDQFMVDGALLVPDPDEATTGCAWRTQIDSGKCFSHDIATKTWTATRDGWTWTWGEKTNSVSAWTGALLWQDEGPDAMCSGAPILGATNATGWLLSSVTDPSGNVIEFEYTSPCDSEGWAAGAMVDGYAWQRVPSVVRYDGGDVELRFVYQDRPDVRGSARDGVLRVLPWRLSGIDIVGDVICGAWSTPRTRPASTMSGMS